MSVVIRQASITDVAQIVRLDSESYGDITEAQTTDPTSMFASRIGNSPGYFWVAEVDGNIEGIFSAQPTHLDPTDFKSWSECTANGTLDGTFAQDSETVYIVALTVSPVGSAVGVTDRLIIAAFKKGIREGKKEAYFASRMPGFYRYSNRMSAEEYAAARRMHRGKEVALDPQIRFYEELGLRKVSVVPEGFAADWKSCGYSVLFTVKMPFYRWPGRTFWSWTFGAVASRSRLVKIISHFT